MQKTWLPFPRAERAQLASGTAVVTVAIACCALAIAIVLGVAFATTM